MSYNVDLNNYVIKRDGRTKETVSFDAIQNRLKDLKSRKPVLVNVDIFELSKAIIEGMTNGIHTIELDNLASKISTNMSTKHYDYEVMASRIAISNHQKNTRAFTFMGVTEKLYRNKNQIEDSHPLVSTDYYKFVEQYETELEQMLDYSRDYLLSYFGFKTLEKAYLRRVAGIILERPQHMFMRVAIALHMNSKNPLEKIKESYDNMSQLRFTHASPTLFNAGCNYPQLLSCFVLDTDDSQYGIMKTQSDASSISKRAGGVGINFSRLRGRGSYIRGTNGSSNGVIPFAQMYDKCANAFNQGGKRKGSFAIYLGIDHPDIFEFIKLRVNTGDEDTHARGLFIGAWVSDYFMRQVYSDGDWWLFDPDATKWTVDGKTMRLENIYGDEYDEKVNELVKEGRYVKKIKARSLMSELAKSQIESGFPYIMFKDSINRKSNHKNLGCIKGSNLCTEIVEYFDTDEYACCTLASIGLSKFVIDTHEEPNNEFPKIPKFDYMALAKIVGIMVENLNIVIDINKYPVIETKLSNYRHRPIGVGVQGLADVYMMMRVPFDSEEAYELNRNIFETIYYSALTKSVELSREKYLNHCKEIREFGETRVITKWKYGNSRIMSPREQLFNFSMDDNRAVIADTEVYTNIDDLPTTAGAYSTYEGSPYSEGILQFDMWEGETKLSGMWDWESLRMKLKKFGLVNSLLLAPMPTASTSQILGNYECFEPVTYNMYTRDTIAGSYLSINKYLINTLTELGVWSEEVKQNIQANKGSVMHIDGIPDRIKNIYKTVWEISQKDIINQAADRGKFIDQTQSMNLYMRDPSIAKVSSMIMYGWVKGLKTGIYYLRSEPRLTAQQFTLPTDMSKLTSVNVEHKTYDEWLKNASSAQFALEKIEDICLGCQ